MEEPSQLVNWSRPVGYKVGNMEGRMEVVDSGEHTPSALGAGQQVVLLPTQALFGLLNAMQKLATMRLFHYISL